MKSLISGLLVLAILGSAYYTGLQIKRGIENRNRIESLQEDLKSGDCDRILNAFMTSVNDADTQAESTWWLVMGYRVYFDCEKKK